VGVAQPERNAGPEYGGVPVGLGGAGDTVTGLGKRDGALPDVNRGPGGKPKAKPKR